MQMPEPDAAIIARKRDIVAKLKTILPATSVVDSEEAAVPMTRMDYRRTGNCR
jgi:hypothetical protein